MIERNQSMHHFFGKKHISVRWKENEDWSVVENHTGSEITQQNLPQRVPPTQEELKIKADKYGVWWPETSGTEDAQKILTGFVDWVSPNENLDWKKIAAAQALQQAQIAKIEAQMHIVETSKRLTDLAVRLKGKFTAVLWKEQESDKGSLSPDGLEKKGKEMEIKAQNLTNEYLTANKEQYLAYKKEIINLPEEEQKTKLVEFRKNMFETFCREKGLELPAVAVSVWEEGADSQGMATSNMTFDSSDDTFDAMEQYVQSTESYKRQHFAEAEADTILKKEFPEAENAQDAVKHVLSEEGGTEKPLSDYLSKSDEPSSYTSESKITIRSGEGFTRIDAPGSENDWIIYSDNQDEIKKAVRLYASFSRPPLDTFRRDGYEYMSAVEVRVAKEINSRVPGEVPSPDDIARVMQFVLLKQNPGYSNDLIGITLKDLLSGGKGIEEFNTFLKNHWDVTSGSILASAQEQWLVTDDNNLKVVNFMKALSELA